jgi:hypothetical protein
MQRQFGCLQFPTTPATAPICPGRLNTKRDVSILERPLPDHRSLSFARVTVLPDSRNETGKCVLQWSQQPEIPPLFKVDGSVHDVSGCSGRSAHCASTRHPPSAPNRATSRGRWELDIPIRAARSGYPRSPIWCADRRRSLPHSSADLRG